MKTGVLIVDDSAVIRSLLLRELSRDPSIEVVGMAADAYEARDRIVELRPDVVTLDVEMPRMDGITFLRRLMRHYPLPVVVVSSLTERGGRLALQALEAGGVDVLGKPGPGLRTAEFAIQLVEKVKAAGRAKVSRERPGAGARPAARGLAGRAPRRKVVVIGASTGGPRALHHLIGALPADHPAVLVVQHMPARFTRFFAERLDAHCRLRVKEAEDGDRVERGLVLIAPGDRHMLLRRRGSDLVVEVKRGPPVLNQRPSIDVVFRSVARALGPEAVGVVLTGMGTDGAQGLLEMRQAGAVTMAQDQASSTVYGMPREAVAIGAAEKIVSLENLAQEIVRQVVAAPAE